MENSYSKGQLLQVHTKNNEVFEGRFYGISKDKSKISLYGIKESDKGEETEGICHYYESEVRDIVKLQDVDDLTKSLNKHLRISEKDCEEIFKVSTMYVYVNQIDSTFHKAVEDLSEYSYIALSTDGASMGRKCNMPFLVLSTPTQIYIFDIQVMQDNAFDAGLRKLLESTFPKKIIHDCRKISDCLFHKHKVELKSVFDTQVGDLIITKNKRGHLPNNVNTLQECLNVYLGLPLNTIEDKLDIVQCSERPLPKSIKDMLAKNIAFLHKLSEYISDEMKLPFLRGVECFMDNLRSCDYYKAWDLCGKQNQLPKEFKNAIEY